jgi:hypothetical protein
VPQLSLNIVRKVLSVTGFLVLTAQFVQAQASLSASRSAEIAPFVQTTLLAPDWGPTNNLGYTVGIDYTRFIRSIVQPSLEIRMTSANGSTVNEHTYTGGLKLQTTIRRVHPYGTFLLGVGDIHFNHPIATYMGDNSSIYALGGGTDLDLTSHLSVRVDFSHQNWNLSHQTLSPLAVGTGFSYRIPFHPVGIR